MITSEARQSEHEKYDRAYSAENYRMGKARKEDAIRELTALPCRGSYLDVSTGRGEMLVQAAKIGFDPVAGTEIVGDLIDGDRIVRAEVHSLPFANKSFDVVTMFDVIEHLLVGDDGLACAEMARVARSHILISANNRPSFNTSGDDLHINKRPYSEWDAYFRAWFPGKVIWLGGMNYVSEMWRVEL